MALRSFTDRNGCGWNCWNVQAPAADHIIADALRGGWLCFQRQDGGERFRLSIRDVPPAWEQLGDDRLDLLRRVAEAGANDNPDIYTVPEASASSEESARGRMSGPHALVGDTAEDPSV